MRSIPARLMVLLCSLQLLVGCGERRPAAESPSAATPSNSAATEGIDLAILNFDEIEQRIASKQGKVVVVDAWSTSCPPCMKDFHNLVELHKQYPPADVACISLSFDYEGLGKPEEASGPVLAFLRQQGATFDNLMSNEESDVLYRKFKLNAVPAVFVYDRTGKLRERFESEGAYEKVRTLVAELVKESAPTEAAGSVTPTDSAAPATGG